MRGNYVIGGFLLMVVGSYLYNYADTNQDTLSAIFSFGGIVLLLAGLFTKKELSELEKLQAEKLKRELSKNRRCSI